MKLPFAAKAAGLTAAAGLALAAGLATAPAAFAATVVGNPTPLPSTVNSTIAQLDLPVQVSNGYEAITGQAAVVDFVRALANSLNIGSVAAYTGNFETGNAILIFTGNDLASTAANAFQVTGNPTFMSFSNSTDQPWYIFSSTAGGLASTAIPAGFAENITGGGNVLSTVGLVLSALTPTAFSITGS
jgi:uncharacterized protein with PIN domain